MDRRRRVHVFSTFAAGGPQVRTTDLMNAMAEEAEHVVVAMDGNFAARSRIAPSVRCRFVEPPTLPGGLANIGALAEFLASLSPGLLLTYNWGAIESVPAARRLGLRVIHAEDGFGPEEAHRLLARRNWARRVWLRSAAHVVVPSSRLERIAQRTWWLGSRVHYVPNGIDVRRFCPGDAQEARRSLGRDARGPVVGTVAALRAEKNLGLLLESFALLRRKIPQASLWIAGDGPERGSLEKAAERLGLGESLWLAGPIGDPAQFYRALDLFALSSSTEQMPLSVTEAMATGLCIVSTPVGDVASMVAPEQRPFLTESSTAPSFVDALERALSSDRREAWGAKNRQRCVERYSFDRMLERYRSLYRTSSEV